MNIDSFEQLTTRIGRLRLKRCGSTPASFEQLTTRIGRLRLKRCGSTPALTIFVVYAPASNYDEEEVEAFFMDFEMFYREDHNLFKVIVEDFNAKIGPRRMSTNLHAAFSEQTV
uniref:Craniofacial development protein 2-like n=1 Tax=Angiostrongylus cantonensis TaxID=6313 RepID=A0A0K0D4A0_ANGCA